MGRELKRVALDFNWPIGKTWEGFVNPHGKACPGCRGGSGTSPERAALEKIVSLIMIAGADSLDHTPQNVEAARRQRRAVADSRGRLWPHPWLADIGILDPGAGMHQLSTGLAGCPPNRPFGHDSIDGWRAVSAVIKAAGLDPETWGICGTCKGSGSDPASQAASAAWRKTEPPEGEG